ncbi:sigma-54-dependent transcriptional regulator [Vogesella indigofera]|uniref:sigma-54-dependent transcriptional regulator n=1 Tax=Vogesella indigofera TaxID=45465 RepID=UPI00234E470E|nr:sigma-54 dependent transcriptional regulator [Vogesella indigofera]MDC7701278.1 sigma-54 dependent transcriptional regulator [Vogesella indigofera]
MTPTSSCVLIVDDEPDLRELLQLTLLKMGLQVLAAANVADACRLLARERCDLVLTDMRLPDGEGLQVVQYIQQQQLDIPVAVITAYGSTENAVAAMKAGAFDYLAKPLSLAALRALVKSALQVREPAPVAGGESRLLGGAAAIRDVRAMIDKLARTQAAVHISGESGTGKEQAARQIHEQSARASQAFVAVNCGAIPETLMESEFFGYRKGAFTGADADRDGFFQLAHGGTLFLDEVADLPLAMQVKLLRAIQEKKVRRLGAAQEEAVDVRLVSATHRDLVQLVEQGRFRQDLYYRLNVIGLAMPPLRELRDDLPQFVARLLQRFSAGSEQPQLDEAALQALLAYHYPGNFRELENILERAVALASDGCICAGDLQLGASGAEAAAPGAQPQDGGETLQDYLDRVERAAIDKALQASDGNRTQAARLLGVSFRSLRYRLERLGMK